MIYVPWKEFYKLAEELAKQIDAKQYGSIYGVPRGGVPLAVYLSSFLNLPLVESPSPLRNTLVVDDLIDSGKTRSQFCENDFAVLHFKNSEAHIPETTNTFCADDSVPPGTWIHYPWETGEEQNGPTDAVTRLIQYIGEDPNREGLQDTPARVVKAYDEMFAGYQQNPEDLLTTFENDGYDQMVLVRDVEVYSMCEHHMLPFFGKAHIAYIPDGRVIGVSKLARLVDLYARRLQIQERICEQVTTAIMEHLQAQGAACVIEAQHMCMLCRGVEKQHSIMTTSSLKGHLFENASARAEFMNLIAR